MQEEGACRQSGLIALVQMWHLNLWQNASEEALALGTERTGGSRAALLPRFMWHSGSAGNTPVCTGP